MRINNVVIEFVGLTHQQLTALIFSSSTSVLCFEDPTVCWRNIELMLGEWREDNIQRNEEQLIGR